MKPTYIFTILFSITLSSAAVVIVPRGLDAREEPCSFTIGRGLVGENSTILILD